MTPTAGWVLATGEQGKTSVLRTADGGKNWQDVTPSGFAQSAVVYFADENTGWAAFQETRDAKSEMTVAHTADGGNAWSRTAFPVLPWEISPWFAFAGSQAGWLVVTSTPALGMMFKSVFHTDDAGANWGLLSRGGGQGGTPTADHLPDSEYVTGVTFRNADEGWVAARYRTSTDAIALYHTGDGGRTWQRQPIAFPDTGGQIRYCDAFPPQFFGDDRKAGVLMLECRGTPDPGWAVPYVTADGGHTWQSRSAIPGMIDDSASYDFISAGQGWVLMDSGELQVTKDGGRTWAQAAKVAAQHGKIDFTDERTGWLLDPNGALSDTTDGGRTWTPLTVTTH